MDCLKHGVGSDSQNVMEEGENCRKYKPRRTPQMREREGKKQMEEKTD